jgi:hypothetical protein
MNLRLEFKKYVVLGMKLPNVGEFYFVGDADKLEDALVMADRQKGILVFEVPADARLADGANFQLDTARVKLITPKERN